MWAKNITDFGRFCHLNIPCLRISITLIFMSSSSEEFTHQSENSKTDILLVSGGHICAPERDTRMASPYNALYSRLSVNVVCNRAGISSNLISPFCKLIDLNMFFQDKSPFSFKESFLLFNYCPLSVDSISRSSAWRTYSYLFYFRLIANALKRSKYLRTVL